MSEITCPNCGKPFAIDESGYAELVKQARDAEFERQVAAHAKQVEEAATAREALISAQAESTLRETIAQKDARAAELAAKLAALKQSAEAERELAVRKASDEQATLLADARREIDALTAKLAAQTDRFESEKQLAVQAAEQALLATTQDAERERDELKARLGAQEENARLSQEIALQKAAESAAEQRRTIERERDELKAQINLQLTEHERAEAQHQIELASRMAVMQEQIDARDREIDNIKHMRAELTVKMIGESLEQFCEDEFNKLRATAFQHAYFQKDNDATGGSKGDYIYRELDEDGNEITSIMFEMKNEADDSTHRKRNEDHFKKLDHDRTAKNCEYAVLVSLLERDSDYYNTGIVDVSFASGYEKMYVIRPQFFIPLITLIRNAATRSLSFRRELAEVRQQNIDVTHFEDQLEDFKGKFGRNCELASRKFQDAIRDINATIKKLEKIREELMSSDNNLRLANNKLNDLTVKRLTRKNPTMKTKFEEARELKESGAVPSYQSEEDWEVVEAEVVEAETVEVEAIEAKAKETVDGEGEGTAAAEIEVAKAEDVEEVEKTTERGSTND
ncbi:DUF2130 domain-containing protein [Adlercreutzia sp. ZJ138]|uniref:DUF2130 domain-containing protein n=1 Tax=Adlercreutzia sp. ZJ138 TaxID=2709405 RepID=UPI0013EA1A69|nr:DUF2130 domain-containing protein [Adlercreutzia sp. ZJ138]